MIKKFAAVDLGATSGRVVLGEFSPGKISMKTVSRFDNGPVPKGDGYHWDFDALLAGVIDGLDEAIEQAGDLTSIAVDSWAVDYGLIKAGKLLNQPFHYRDERTATGVNRIRHKHSKAELFELTGLQFLPFNTIYQLAADKNLGEADQILLIPDLVGFFLTGESRTEVTNASTTGLLNAQTRDWEKSLTDAKQWPPFITPGETLGTYRGIPVVAVGSHDTASAVVGVPLSSKNSAYISCGTWGLVGLELEKPILSVGAREANFTNELGVDNRVRFLHNVMGLWLLTESMKQFDTHLQDLLEQAEKLEEPVTLFDANDPRFMPPGKMAGRIADWCIEHGKPVPQNPAEFVRSIIESLAFAFSQAVAKASELSSTAVDVVHVVGGGALNRLLCQRIADYSSLKVIAGPVEATALGNLLVQARAAGVISGTLEELRTLIPLVEKPITYLPKERV